MDRNVWGGVEYANRKAFKQNEEEKSMEEKVDTSLEKIDSIMEHAHMVSKAEEIINHIKLSVLLEMRQEKLEKLTDPYDPVVILAICKKLHDQNLLKQRELH
jgi:hypothetical protein